MIWQNEEFRRSLLRGIADFSAGRVEPVDMIGLESDDIDGE